MTSTNSSTRSKFVSSKKRLNSPSDAVGAEALPEDAKSAAATEGEEEEEDEIEAAQLFPSNCSKPKSLLPFPANPMLFPSNETLGNVLGGLKEAKACSRASEEGCGQRLRRGGGRVGCEEEEDAAVVVAVSSFIAANGGVRICGSAAAMEVDGGAAKMECCIDGRGCCCC